MAATWKRSDGDIAEVLKTLFASRRIPPSLGRSSRIRSTSRLGGARRYGAAIVNAQPILNWLNRMGEPLYGHETPDGYALRQTPGRARAK